MAVILAKTEKTHLARRMPEGLEPQISHSAQSRQDIDFVFPGDDSF